MDKLQISYSFQAYRRSCKQFLELTYLLREITLKRENRLDFGNCFRRDTFRTHLLFHLFLTYLIKLVQSYCKVNQLIRSSNNLSKTREYLTVIHLDCYSLDLQGCKDTVIELNKLHFLPKATSSYHIGIALIELTIAPLLWAICTPNGLYLITLERKSDLILMLHHITSKRYRKIIAQCFLTYLRSNPLAVAFLIKILRYIL